MVVKLIKSASDSRSFGCDFFDKEYRLDHVAVTLHYHPTTGKAPIVLNLPRDGEIIYVEDAGRTVDTIRWPARVKAVKDKDNDSDKGNAEDDGGDGESKTPTYRGLSVLEGG